MTTDQVFGGDWTEEKLTRVRKYLEAYVKIFTKNPKAAFFRTIYVDAFAGSGLRKPGAAEEGDTSGNLFEEDSDADSFMKGSAQVALEVEPGFDQYLFIEKNPEFSKQLSELCGNYPDKASRISIRTGDANQTINEWAGDTDWNKNRAVVFLDPYGMQVEWATLETLANTQGVDLWLLFPLGQGVNRLLTRGTLPPNAWGSRLTCFLGTEGWKEAFYQRSSQIEMFDDEPHFEKRADFGLIGDFFMERLSTIFSKVARNPLPLCNSRNNPIFLLCFASANPRGAPTAVRIAGHLLKQ